MVNFVKILSLAGGLCASGVLSHPETVEEVRARSVEVGKTRRAMAVCAEKHQANGLAKRHAERRAAFATAVRKERGIVSNSWETRKRSLQARQAAEHNQTVEYDDLTRPDDVVFEGGDPACILASEAVVGPYYVDGEIIRNDITDGVAKGVQLDLDLLIIDVSTCDPIPNMFIDAWHANSTGVYSGVVSGGNGDSEDETNWDSTHGRGIASTNDEGIVTFNTEVTGHYTGRAPHIHVLTHSEGEVLPNKTFKSGRASHVGQIYFDQDLITEVEKTSPYSENEQELTLNDDDGILQMQLEGSDADPFVDYVYYGDSVSDGIFAWITLAVDTTAEQDVTPVAHWTEDGGVPNEDAPDQPGGPPPSENGAEGFGSPLRKLFR